MRVVFRVDASTHIGTGHVMRCLTLAQALRDRGATCSFVSRMHPGHLVEQVRERGFEVRALPAMQADALRQPPAPVHAGWLGADWQTDAQQTLAALAGASADWLVVDHYAVDAQWERGLRAACRRLMAIDDLADRAHDCDLLLDQNLGRVENDYSRLVPSHCQVLAGASFALVRPEFATLRAASTARRQRAGIDRLLVSMGGVDKENITSGVLRALEAAPLPLQAHVDVVMGKHAPWLAAVRDIAAGMKRPAQVHVDTPDMAALMAQADLAIGAAGSTSWERCVVGLPALVVVLAENQREAAQALGASGAVRVVENGPALASSLYGELGELVRHPAELRAMSARALLVCDGSGTAAVLRHMWSDPGEDA